VSEAECIQQQQRRIEGRFYRVLAAAAAASLSG